MKIPYKTIGILLILFFLIFVSLIFSSFSKKTDSFLKILNLKGILSAEEIYEMVSGSVYIINSFDIRGLSQGSAVAVSDNYLATNHHVASRFNILTVEINGNTHLANVFKSFPATDLCIIAVPGKKFKPLKIRKTSSVKIGEDVFAVGSPHGYENCIRPVKHTYPK